MLPTEISFGSQQKKKSINKMNLLWTPDTVPVCYIPSHAHIAGLYFSVFSPSLFPKPKIQMSGSAFLINKKYRYTEWLETCSIMLFMLASL